MEVAGAGKDRDSRRYASRVPSRFLLLLSLLKGTNTYLYQIDPMNGDGRAKGNGNGRGHEMRHVLCLWFVFFLLIFFIQYSGRAIPTNGQGHEMRHVPGTFFYISFKYAN